MTDNKALFDEIDEKRRHITSLQRDNEILRRSNANLLKQFDEAKRLQKEIQEIVGLYYVDDNSILLTKLRHMLDKK